MVSPGLHLAGIPVISSVLHTYDLDHIFVSDFAYIYSVKIWWTSNVYNPKFHKKPGRKEAREITLNAELKKDLVSVSN